MKSSTSKLQLLMSYFTPMTFNRSASIIGETSSSVVLKLTFISNEPFAEFKKTFLSFKYMSLSITVGS